MNKEQFEETYEECRKSVHAYLQSRLRDRTVVQDLVQDTFVRFFKSSFNSWNDKGYRNKYVLLIAKNCWRSYIKNFVNNPVRNCTLSTDLILNKKKYFSTDYKIFLKEHTDSDIGEGNNFDFLEGFYNDNDNALSLLFNDYLSAHNNEEKYDRALIEKMINIIYCLPEKQKQAILMVYVNDIKVKDAAAILKTSPNCVSFSLFKAKETIRKKLTNVQNLLCK